MDAVYRPEGQDTVFLRHRIDELSDRVRDAEESIGSLRQASYTERMTAELIKKDIVFIKTGMEDLLATVKELRNVPSARWNQVVTALIAAAVAAVWSILT